MSGDMLTDRTYHHSIERWINTVQNVKLFMTSCPDPTTAIRIYVEGVTPKGAKNIEALRTVGIRLGKPSINTTETTKKKYTPGTWRRGLKDQMFALLVGKPLTWMLTTKIIRSLLKFYGCVGSATLPITGKLG